jgi:hypothetical protein
MTRALQPELLDLLPAENPEAIRSRHDLRRVNAWMGHRQLLTRALNSLPATNIHRIFELGAGDGTFALSLATQLSRRWPDVEITLLDRQHIVTHETLNGFKRVGWKPCVVQADVFVWLATAAQSTDLVIANLFLHHFDEPQLRQLLRASGLRCTHFVGLEPRRHRIARLGCKLLWLIGCNRVTRHDARASVRAGFRGLEISYLWPDAGNWNLREQPAGMFSHLFAATRNSP